MPHPKLRPVVLWLALGAVVGGRPADTALQPLPDAAAHDDLGLERVGDALQSNNTAMLNANASAGLQANESAALSENQTGWQPTRVLPPPTKEELELEASNDRAVSLLLLSTCTVGVLVALVLLMAPEWPWDELPSWCSNVGALLMEAQKAISLVWITEGAANEKKRQRMEARGGCNKAMLVATYSTLCFLGALSVGALSPIQATVNQLVASSYGSPILASALCEDIELLLLIPISFLVFTQPAKGESGSGPSPGLRMWMFGGGPLGGLYVGSLTVLRTMLPVQVMFVAVNLGQLVAATVMDGVGFAGLTKRPLTQRRAAAIVVNVAACIVLQIHVTEGPPAVAKSHAEDHRMQYIPWHGGPIRRPTGVDGEEEYGYGAYGAEAAPHDWTAFLLRASLYAESDDLHSPATSGEATPLVAVGAGATAAAALEPGRGDTQKERLAQAPPRAADAPQRPAGGLRVAGRVNLRELDQRELEQRAMDALNHADSTDQKWSWRSIGCVLWAMLAGASVSVQTCINTRLAAHIRGAWRAGFMCAFIACNMLALMYLWQRLSTGRETTISALPWELPLWQTLSGGFMGVMCAVLPIVLTPTLGVATFYTIVLLGQLLCAMIWQIVASAGAGTLEPYKVVLCLVATALAISGNYLVRDQQAQGSTSTDNLEGLGAASEGSEGKLRE